MPMISGMTCISFIAPSRTSKTKPHSYRKSEVRWCWVIMPYTVLELNRMHQGQNYCSGRFFLTTVLGHKLSFTIWIPELIKISEFFSWSTSKDTQFTGRSEGKKERNKVILGCFSRNSWNFFLSYSADCCINFGLILLTAKFAISIFIRSNTEKIALNKQTEKVIQRCRCFRGAVYKIYYRLSKERAKTCMGNSNSLTTSGHETESWSKHVHACMCLFQAENKSCSPVRKPPWN